MIKHRQKHSKKCKQPKGINQEWATEYNRIWNHMGNPCKLCGILNPMWTNCDLSQSKCFKCEYTGIVGNMAWHERTFHKGKY